MIIKKISYIFIILTLFFSSCSDTNEEKGLSLKQLSDFNISIPSSWIIIESEDSTILPTPSYGKISLVASSAEPKDGFSNNILILEDNLNTTISSKDFSIFTNLGARDDYQNYKEIESKEFIFNNKEISELYIFEATYATNTPSLKFMQIAYICEDTSYLLTIALSSFITDFSKYEDILKTFECKNKE